MVAPVFPAIDPTVGTRESIEYATLDAAFGDGYRQSVVNGLNARRVQWALEWRYIKAAQAHQIASFLDARAGAGVFSWMPPGETIAALWRCRQCDHTRVNVNVSIVTAQFERYYGPEP